MIPFTKLHGIGNDFVLVDLLARPELSFLPAEHAVAWCDRRFGIGADGLIVVERGENAPFRMRMWNPDGTESGMCGNGTRCVGHYLFERLVESESFPLELSDRVVSVSRGAHGVSVDMGRFSGLESVSVAGFEGFFTEIGNPHWVSLTDDVLEVDLPGIGPKIENDVAFPNRTNVHFTQVLSPDSVRQRTWERGAGITLACGSGACAGAFVAHKTGRCGSVVHVELPGGVLRIEITADDRAIMSGRAELAFEGVMA
jgi:diaminopimelate epimerase